MSAATADRQIVTIPSLALLSLYVAADTRVFGGTLACQDDDGYLVPGADTAGLQFAGVIADQADNRDGAAGAIRAECYRRGAFRFDIAAAADTDLGRPVFVVDDQTVGFDTSSSVDAHVYCGRVAQVESATKVWVEIDSACGELRQVYTRPVEAADVISAGTMVCLDANGDLVVGADSSGLRFAGVATAAADNAGGADGAVSVSVQVSGVRRFGGAGFAKASVGKSAYILTASTVTTSAGAVTNHVYVGQIVAFVSSTAVLVEMRVGARDPNALDGFAFAISGVNATALSLATVASELRPAASGIYVRRVRSAISSAASTGAIHGFKAAAGHHSISAGNVVLAVNASASTLSLAIDGVIKE